MNSSKQQSVAATFGAKLIVVGFHIFVFLIIELPLQTYQEVPGVFMPYLVVQFLLQFVDMRFRFEVLHGRHLIPARLVIRLTLLCFLA